MKPAIHDNSAEYQRSSQQASQHRARSHSLQSPKRLAHGAGRLRLRIGQALHRLGDGIHELGFSTLGAYALERCNRGARWAAETRTLALTLPVEEAWALEATRTMVEHMDGKSTNAHFLESLLAQPTPPTTMPH